MILDTVISVSPSITQPHMQRQPLGSVLNAIATSENIERIISDIRKSDNPDDGKRKRLPWFVPAIFTDDTATNDALVESYAAVIDIDDIADTNEITNRLSADKHVMCAFDSAGGHGVKLIVPFERPVISNDEYSATWRHLAFYLEAKYDITIDNTPDCRRGSFMSFDPFLSLKEAVGYPIAEYKPIDNPPSTICQRDDDEVMAACVHLAGKLPQSDWVRAGMGLAAELGESGVDYFLALSVSPNYPQDTPPRMRARFNSMIRHNSGRVTLSTIFWLAKQHGWVSAKKSQPQARPKTIPRSKEPRSAASRTTQLVPKREPCPVLAKDAMYGYLTEAKVAELWRKKFGDDYRFNHTDNKWYHWNGQYWERDECNAIYQTGIALGQEIAALKTDDEDQEKHVKKVGRELQTSRRVKTMLELAATHETLRTQSKHFETHLDHITCNNGIVDLRTGELLPYDRSMMFSRKIDASYTPGVTGNFFPQFINRIVVDKQEQPDPTLLDYIQRACGYSLTGRTSGQCVFFLHGNASNGKSQLILMLSSILGDYGHTVNPKVIAPRGNYNADPSISSLEGKRLAAVGELDERVVLDEAIIKRLTGSDKIEANQKYVVPHQFTPTHTLWMQGNERPEVKSLNDGIWRRIHLISMLAKIRPDERIPDDELQAKLWADRDAIFTWIVAGSVASYRVGVTPPNSVVEAVKSYRKDEDAIGQFIEENLFEKYDNEPDIKAISVYQRYESWCKISHERPDSKRHFYDHLRRRGIKITRENANGTLRKGNILYILDKRLGENQAANSNASSWCQG